jgi:hypothetical protein
MRTMPRRCAEHCFVLVEVSVHVVDYPRPLKSRDDCVIARAFEVLLGADPKRRKNCNRQADNDRTELLHVRIPLRWTSRPAAPYPLHDIAPVGRTDLVAIRRQVVIVESARILRRTIATRIDHRAMRRGQELYCGTTIETHTSRRAT